MISILDLNFVYAGIQDTFRDTFEHANEVMLAMETLRRHGAKAGFVVHTGPEMLGHRGQRGWGLRRHLEKQGWSMQEAETFIMWFTEMVTATGGRCDVATDPIGSKPIARIMLQVGCEDDEDALVYQLALNAGATVIVTDDRDFRKAINAHAARTGVVLEGWTPSDAVEEVDACRKVLVSAA